MNIETSAILARKVSRAIRFDRPSVMVIISSLLIGEISRYLFQSAWRYHYECVAINQFILDDYLPHESLFLNLSAYRKLVKFSHQSPPDQQQASPLRALGLLSSRCRS